MIGLRSGKREGRCPEGKCLTSAAIAATAVSAAAYNDPTARSFGLSVSIDMNVRAVCFLVLQYISRANAGSATLSADAGSSTQIC